nr:MBL fold metallo-hydrolase [Maliibacterium massiliense]
MKSAHITYLYHSGFAVETEHHFLVFDYYLDEVPRGKRRCIDEGVITAADLPQEKQVTVFVSHNHGDHFNPVIFKWRKEHPHVEYVAASDVRTRSKCVRMAPYEHIDLGGLGIDTYGSTDAGVSFAVQADGLSLFHAGDLNLWHWIEESTPEEVKWAKRAFLKELEHLKGVHFDVAFFPVDPRMGRGHDAGAAHFARTLKPALIIPMHFEDKIATGTAFADKMMRAGQLAWAPEMRGDYCDFDPDDLA